jgi:hypothetical protein
VTTKAIVLTGLLLLALAVPGVAGNGFAASIPTYFEDEWVGFVCLTASPPGSPPTGVLLQLNFDKVALGGISLTTADSLFAFLTGNLGLLSPIIGNNPQTTCSRTPSQIQAQFPGVNALQATQQLSGTFQQIGFPRYIVVDAFFSLVAPYLGTATILRTDVFLVTGNNDLSYAAGNEIVDSLIP